MKKKGRIMQVLASFLFLFVLLTCHTNLKAQGKAVNMNYKEVSFVEAINSFRQQTGVKFLYNLEMVPPLFYPIRRRFAIEFRQIC